MIRYLSRAEVAERINVRPATLARYELPEPDAMLGKYRGWLPETIDRWNAQRPGAGARTDLGRTAQPYAHGANSTAPAVTHSDRE